MYIQLVRVPSSVSNKFNVMSCHGNNNGNNDNDINNKITELNSILLRIMFICNIFVGDGYLSKHKYIY